MSKGFVFRNFILSSGIGGKLSTSQDDENIKDSLRVLLTTSKGERAGMPEYGCSITERVFDPNDPMQEIIMREDILEAIQKWEPRVEVNNVEFTLNEDGYTIDTVIDYSTRKLGPDETMIDKIQWEL